MSVPANPVLVINAGSSSLKFAVYHIGHSIEEWLSGETDSIGKPNGRLRFQRNDGTATTIEADTAEQPVFVHFLKDWLMQRGYLRFSVIAHRLVHGLQHTAPAFIDRALLDDLKKIAEIDPDHLPASIKWVELFTQFYPDSQQVACFDTAFHQTMPRHAFLLPVPAKFREEGIRRYGFHGLSYAYLIDALKKVEPQKANGKVVMAHLGSGASLCALENGKSVDTSMGFTPTGGIPMSSRSGDLDPGVVLHMMQSAQAGFKQLTQMLNKESGLRGLSGSSSDMKTLLDAQSADAAAADAVAVFCYQVRKWIGAYAAALGGIDVLLFSGGIGEKSPEIRRRSCEGLGFLGIELDEQKNQSGELLISSAQSRIPVYVMKTNESIMIARAVMDLLNQSP